MQLYNQNLIIEHFNIWLNRFINSYNLILMERRIFISKFPWSPGPFSCWPQSATEYQLPTIFHFKLTRVNPYLSPLELYFSDSYFPLLSPKLEEQENRLLCISNQKRSNTENEFIFFVSINSSVSDQWGFWGFYSPQPSAIFF